MSDWFRSLTVLSVAFAAVVASTLGLAMVIVPGPAVSTQTSDGTPAASETDDVPATIGAAPTGVGGTLTVSGDRQETFTVDREVTDRRYGLTGSNGRIFFAGDPLAVEQVNFDGLSIFPEPEECTITPGELNPAIGVATANLECVDIADVRGNGVITVTGTVGLAGDVLGMRGDLPPTGGTIDIGGETFAFTDAVLFAGALPAMAVHLSSMELHDLVSETRLSFTYDPATHQLALTRVGLDTGGPDSRVSELADDACTITTQEVGVLNPRVTLIELILECPDVDGLGLGPVAISGSLMVEQTEAAQ